MAKRLIKNKNTIRNKIAAEVFSTNPISGLSAQRKTWTGSTVVGLVISVGELIIKATIPTISNGAVSPRALAIANIVPVKIPGSAKGKT